MERIEIIGLELWARHGVGEQEREVGNLFSIDISLEIDLSKAMDSDNVDDTISYADVIEVIKAEMSQPSALLENVISRIKTALLSRYPRVHSGNIALSKLTPPITCTVARVTVSTRW